MQHRAGCLAVALACAGAARAQDAPRVQYVCGDGRHHDRIEIRTADAAASATVEGTAEWIDATGLVAYGPENAQGDAMRTGSREIERRCGRYRVVFRGGYYNPNPQGELGAADDYPMAEVLDGARSLTGRIALGACDADNPREGYLAQCPDAWAERITVYGDADPARVVLRHRFDRELDPAPAAR